MATTLTERVTALEQQLMEQQQRLNAVVMTFDSYKAAYNADVLAIKQWMQTKQLAPSKPEAPREEVRAEPWRLPLDRFLDWKVGIEQNWEPGGNAKTGQKLAQHLHRSSGHAEGQLYLNWKQRVGEAACRSFWISRGFKDIPDGL